MLIFNAIVGVVVDFDRYFVERLQCKHDVGIMSSCWHSDCQQYIEITHRKDKIVSNWFQPLRNLIELTSAHYKFYTKTKCQWTYCRIVEDIVSNYFYFFYLFFFQWTKTIVIAFQSDSLNRRKELLYFELMIKSISRFENRQMFSFNTVQRRLFIHRVLYAFSVCGCVCLLIFGLVWFLLIVIVTKCCFWAVNQNDFYCNDMNLDGKFSCKKKRQRKMCVDINLGHVENLVKNIRNENSRDSKEKCRQIENRIKFGFVLLDVFFSLSLSLIQFHGRDMSFRSVYTLIKTVKRAK